MTCYCMTVMWNHRVQYRSSPRITCFSFLIFLDISPSLQSRQNMKSSVHRTPLISWWCLWTWYWANWRQRLRCSTVRSRWVHWSILQYEVFRRVCMEILMPVATVSSLSATVDVIFLPLAKCAICYLVYKKTTLKLFWRPFSCLVLTLLICSYRSSHSNKRADSHLRVFEACSNKQLLS